jgi:CubicO group peptidase (beta-lactamase class C family)
MTGLFVRRVGLAFGLTLAGSSVAAQGGRFDLERTRTVLSRLIETALKDRGVPSISIALVKGDSIVWKAAFGYANVRTKTPATTETLYSTGSTFKSATATAIMQLVEQGKINLDAPVNRYLGDSPVQDRLQSEKPVTVTHILSHWSGLISGATTKPIWGRELPNPLEKMVSKLYSIRPPETKWEYNNFAYGLAGLIVQKVSGVEYEKYMVENVLRPLGVTTPHPVYPSAEMVELMALPYMTPPYVPGGPAAQPKPVQQVHYDVYPAGDIYLTPEDMARFLGAHVNGGTFQGHRILSEASVTKMHEPLFGGTYGFGFGIKKDDKGHTIITHGGGIPGQSSNMVGDVDAHVGVYYMSNSGAPGELADAAIALLRGEDYVPTAERKGVAVDSKVLDGYVGVYQLEGANTITITRDGSTLYAQMAGPQPKGELLAESPTRFVAKVFNFRLIFGKSSAGADQVTLDMGTIIQFGRKLDR